MNADSIGFEPGRLISAVKATFSDPMRDLATSGLVLGGILIVFLLAIAVLYLSITPGKRKVVTVRRYRRPPGSGVAPASGNATGTDSGGEPLPEAPEDAAAHEDGAASDSEPSGAPVSAEERVTTATQARARRARIASGIAGATVSVIVVAAFVGGYVVSGTQRTCARTCHLGQEQVAAAATDTHADCTGCHERPGPVGVVPNAVQRTRMAVKSMLGVVPERRTLVRSETCIGCHAEVLEPGRVTSGTIRMSHAEPAAAGVTCTECHPGIGHGGGARYSMAQCTSCHRPSGASAECQLCHAPGSRTAERGASAETTVTTVTADALGSGRITYPVVRVGDLPCGGCHDEPVQCDSCHGLRMPHPEQFRRGGHARMAAFERKAMCFRCHDSGWCSTGCHIGFEAGHVANWKTLHQEAPRDATCGCHATRSGRTTPMCDLCHDF